MAQRRTGARKSTIWFPQRGTSTTALDALAAAAQGTVFDLALEHPGTNQDYDGAIFGVRIWTFNAETFSAGGAAMFVLMKLPQGLAVPSVATTATLKQNEGYIWAQSVREFQTAVTPANPNQLTFELKSARSFSPGDRLVLVCINVGIAAYGATMEIGYVLDSYIMPR